MIITCGVFGESQVVLGATTDVPVEGQIGRMTEETVDAPEETAPSIEDENDKTGVGSGHQTLPKTGTAPSLFISVIGIGLLVIFFVSLVRRKRRK